MDIKKSRTPLLMVGLIVVILACNVPSSEDVLPASAGQPAAVESIPPAETPIPHLVIPAGLPEERSSHAGDYDSSTSAASKQASGGDRFTFGRFERPFNANTMDTYFPHLDIVDTLVFQDDTWIYGSIQMQGPDANGALPDKYAVELDLDLDGKGDWLIIASAPTSTDWTTDGMQAFHDANKDVGSEAAMYTDENSSGDGFETLAFDQGIGNDPDTAWVRISPTNPNVVEISIKRSVLGDPQKYLINMWAGTALLDPALFDLNDHFSHEQAGAADAGLQVFYPIKEIAELDNSCRMAVGFQPTGQEPGLCEVFLPEPPPGCRLTPASCSTSEYFDAPSCTCRPVIIF